MQRGGAAPKVARKKPCKTLKPSAVNQIPGTATWRQLRILILDLLLGSPRCSVDWFIRKTLNPALNKTLNLLIWRHLWSLLVTAGSVLITQVL